MEIKGKNCSLAKLHTHLQSCRTLLLYQVEHWKGLMFHWNCVSEACACVTCEKLGQQTKANVEYGRTLLVVQISNKLTRKDVNRLNTVNC